MVTEKYVLPETEYVVPTFWDTRILWYMELGTASHRWIKYDVGHTGFLWWRRRVYIDKLEFKPSGTIHGFVPKFEWARVPNHYEFWDVSSRLAPTRTLTYNDIRRAMRKFKKANAW